MLTNFHKHFIRSEGIEILNLEHLKDEKNHLFSYGIHPKDSEKEIINEEILLSLNCLAIGEIGLDKLIDVAFDLQKRIFLQQVELSEKHELPVIIHCVKAWNEILEIKKELKPNQPWIYHGFRKSNLIESVLKSGCYISIGTAIIFDQKLQQSIQHIPLEKLFLETDNDTSYSIQEVYESVARLKNI